MKTRSLSLVCMFFLACGLGDGGKQVPPPLTPLELVAARQLSVNAGGYLDPFTGTSSGGTQGLMDQRTSAQPLASNESAVFRIELPADLTLHAAAIPRNAYGDIDVFVLSGPAAVASSIRGTDRADAVYYRIPSQQRLVVRYFCYSGPCSFEAFVSVGNDQEFVSAGCYLNQRANRTVSGKCTNSGGAAIADGECQCGPTSAAMGLACLGQVDLSHLDDVVADLYTTNLSGGAANRNALMRRLESIWGLIGCTETSGEAAFAALKEATLRGDFVLFRSPRFSVTGHFIRGRGYAGDYLVGDDPVGNWRSRGWWSPLNSTDAASREGALRYYDRHALVVGGASVIVCGY
jgi:hypothetical protein